MVDNSPSDANSLQQTQVIPDSSNLESELNKIIQRLRKELNTASWHFEIYKQLNELSSTYTKEMQQAPAFWGLTREAHLLIALMLLNHFFDKKDAHLNLFGLFDFAENNLELFSEDNLNKRLNKCGRNNEIAEYNRIIINETTIQKHRQQIRTLPVSSLRKWRNSLLAHIDKSDVFRDVNVRATFQIKHVHLEKIIETVDQILNYYNVAYDCSSWARDIPLEGEIHNILRYIKTGFEQRRAGYWPGTP